MGALKFDRIALMHHRLMQMNAVASGGGVETWLHQGGNTLGCINE